MEYRQLGASGFKVPALTLGTGTFGGGNEFFKAWGGSDVAEASKLVDICLEAGLTMFDSADGYSNGLAEERWFGDRHHRRKASCSGARYALPSQNDRRGARRAG